MANELVTRKEVLKYIRKLLKKHGLLGAKVRVRENPQERVNEMESEMVDNGEIPVHCQFEVQKEQ